MFGVLLLILLLTRNIMSVLLMIIVNLLRFIFFITNMKFLSIFLNFIKLLNACLIARLLLFNLIGEGSMRN
jgi:hypothetical protein